MFLPSYNLISVEQLAETTIGTWASTFAPPATSISFLSHNFIKHITFCSVHNLPMAAFVRSDAEKTSGGLQV